MNNHLENSFKLVNPAVETPMKKGALFSEDRRYRYLLWRDWEKNARKRVAFVGLNPSTADETEDDNTVRRCIDFAKRWGYDGMFMLNIFAFRATDPKVMKREKRPIGPMNDKYILAAAKDCGPDSVVGCWGSHGAHFGRGIEVSRMLARANGWHMCLGKTASMHPKHPLYLSRETEIEVY